MKSFLAILVVTLATASQSQSLHFVSGGGIPFQRIAGDVFGRIAEPRIDVLRSKHDWDTYFSAQSGFFGGPAVTTLIQPDFCREQVVAVSLGNDGTFGKVPCATVVRTWDDYTWEIVIDLNQIATDQIGGKSLYSPYVAFRTPRGPDNYRFVFLSAEGREVVDLRSAIDSYRLPRDWWRCHDENGRGGR